MVFLFLHFVLYHLYRQEITTSPNKKNPEVFQHLNFHAQKQHYL